MIEVRTRRISGLSSSNPEGAAALSGTGRTPKLRVLLRWAGSVCA
jgi:hypothetical protein